MGETGSTGLDSELAILITALAALGSVITFFEGFFRSHIQAAVNSFVDRSNQLI